MTPVVDPDLREVFLGEWEGGLLRQKARRPRPRAGAGVAGGALGRDPRRRVPRRSSGADCGAPLRPSRRRTRAGASSVFSHGAAIGEILAQASGSKPFAFMDTDNASISRLVVTPDRWIVRSYNDTAHLAG